MKVTREIVRAIKAACRKACGGRRSVEIGQRSWPGMNFPDDNDGLNFLLWGSEHDLSESWKPDELVGQEIKDDAGWVALDCYCYNLPVFGHDPDNYLDRNVYVLISPDGKVVYASQDDLGHAAAIDEILRRHGHPGYQYTD